MTTTTIEQIRNEENMLEENCDDLIYEIRRIADDTNRGEFGVKWAIEEEIRNRICPEWTAPIAVAIFDGINRCETPTTLAEILMKAYEVEINEDNRLEACHWINNLVQSIRCHVAMMKWPVFEDCHPATTAA